MAPSPHHNQAVTHKTRPELHVTAELGVLEAPAGAVMVGGNLHVFHQFRPRPTEGSRWAHQVASDVPYDWDVCDDVLTPQGEEVDVLAGSSVLLTPDPNHNTHPVELFFVTSSPRSAKTPARTLLGNHIRHGERGERTFCVQRALIPNLTELADASDDPTLADARVQRLGPIDIDDSAYPIEDLVTPSVLWHNNTWLMVALALEGNTGARIVILTSDDRQHWTVLGPLELSGDSQLPSERPYAPRLLPLTDEATGEEKTVLFITFPDARGSHEITGYVVGTLHGTTFATTTSFTVFDHGHDFTRPRVISTERPVLFGLVGAHPDFEGQWANCLTSPRFLSLVNGHIYQDIAGIPRAVSGYSDRALLWTGQLEPNGGSVAVNVLSTSGERLVRVCHHADTVTLTREGDSGAETVSARMIESDSATLTVFVDGPVCEVFADGGAASLTSAIPARQQVGSVQVEVRGRASIINSMVTVGQELISAEGARYETSSPEITSTLP